MGEEPEKASGPLAGIRIIEMAGLGPVPLAGFLLAELGADIVRIERLTSAGSLLNLPPHLDNDRLGRAIVKVDLKSKRGVAFVLDLCRKADILLEGFRPGVMERLGLGPQSCHKANPGLIYGRMTGFGQDGPLAERAGHDLTYLALTGLLDAIGPKGGKPVPPLNLVADYGGGTMFLITGILSALIERSRSGHGQTVDAAMVDGASALASMFFALTSAGQWQQQRGSNLLDSGAPFYDTYETSDGKFVAVACLEPSFFAEFANLLPLDEKLASAQYNRKSWPEMQKAIAGRMRQKTRAEWSDHFDGSDACVAPVLTLTEAPGHPHNLARQSHIKEAGGVRPAPAPRFSRTPASPAGKASDEAGTNTILSHFGISRDHLASLQKSGDIDI